MKHRAMCVCNSCGGNIELGIMLVKARVSTEGDTIHVRFEQGSIFVLQGVRSSKISKACTYTRIENRQSSTMCTLMVLRSENDRRCDQSSA